MLDLLASGQRGRAQAHAKRRARTKALLSVLVRLEHSSGRVLATLEAATASGSSGLLNATAALGPLSDARAALRDLLPLAVQAHRDGWKLAAFLGRPEEVAAAAAAQAEAEAARRARALAVVSRGLDVALTSLLQLILLVLATLWALLSRGAPWCTSRATQLLTDGRLVALLFWTMRRVGHGRLVRPLKEGVG